MTVNELQVDIDFWLQRLQPMNFENRGGFKLFPAQEEVVRCEAREPVGGGGEGSGKSITAAVYTLCRIHLADLIWLVGAEYERVKKEFQYITEFGTYLGIVEKGGYTKNINPGRVKFVTGATLETKSATDPSRIGEDQPDIIVECEAGLIDEETKHRLRGRAARKRGWHISTGSFNSSFGGFVDSWTTGQAPNALDIKSFSLPSWINTYLYPGGREDPEILRLERSMTFSRFMERHVGMPCPPSNRVIYNADPKLHAKKLSINPDLPVAFTIDPGYAPGAFVVLAIQIENNGMHDVVQVIDEIYVQHLVAEQVAFLAMKRPWWKQTEEFGIVDVAGTYHAGAMPPVSEKWREVTKKPLYGRRVEVKAGIDRLNEFLLPHPVTNLPSLVIDSVNCPGLSSEWGFGKSPVDGGGVWLNKTDHIGNVIGGPEKRNNHASTALIYHLIDRYGYGERGGVQLFRTARDGSLVEIPLPEQKVKCLK